VEFRNPLAQIQKDGGTTAAQAALIQCSDKACMLNFTKKMN
jgi:hypothetical protein